MIWNPLLAKSFKSSFEENVVPCLKVKIILILKVFLARFCLEYIMELEYFIRHQELCKNEISITKD